MTLRRTISTDGSYGNVLLAFLDVLGFGELLDGPGAASPGPILQLFDTAYSSKHDWPPSVIHRRVISDSVILWTTTDAPVGALALLSVAAELQQNLFRMGVLVRGAVVSGQHYSQRVSPLSQQSASINAVDDEILISHALRDAVLLERSTLLPRIVLDGSIQARLDLAVKQYGELMHLQYGHDLTGALIVPGLYGTTAVRVVTKTFPAKLQSEWWPDRDPSTLANEFRGEAEEFLRRQKGLIDQALARHEPRILEKWRYIAREHNHVVAQANAACGLSLSNRTLA